MLVVVVKVRVKCIPGSDSFDLQYVSCRAGIKPKISLHLYSFISFTTTIRLDLQGDSTYACVFRLDFYRSKTSTHTHTMSNATRAVRADFTEKTITVYQAYSAQIAVPALRAQKFVAPFKRERMTWIKPSFLWMAYRCGWGTKPNQERVLAIEITREGFEWALSHSCLSHYNPQHGSEDHENWEKRKRTSPVRVQWDPERNLHLAPLKDGQRSIQIGIGGGAVDKYVDEWIVSIRDVTDSMHEISRLVASNELDAAQRALPAERPYPLPDEVAKVVGAS